MRKRGLTRAVVSIGLLAAAWAAGHALVSGTPPGKEGAELEAEVRDRTLALFEAKHRADPENPIAAARLVDGYRLRFRTGADLSDLRRAGKVARASLATAPDGAAALARLSRVRLDLHDFDGALEAARRAVEADSADESARAALFDAALAVGDRAAAEAYLASLPEGSYARRLREVRWMADEGRTRAALRAQRRVCERLDDAGGSFATVAWCRTQVADLAHQTGDPTEARAWLERALEVWPGYRAAVEGLADLAYARQDWGRAGDLYREILSEAHPDLFLRLAEVARARGEEHVAEVHERRFLALVSDPALEDMYARSMALYLAARGTGRRALPPEPGDMDRALELALVDMERRPTPATYESLAWIRLLRGELDAALEASDRARRRGDPGPTSDYHRARILEAMGRRAEARPLYDAALAGRTRLAPHALADSRERSRRP